MHFLIVFGWLDQLFMCFIFELSFFIVQCVVTKIHGSIYKSVFLKTFIFFIVISFSHLNLFKTARPSSKYKPNDSKLVLDKTSKGICGVWLNNQKVICAHGSGPNMFNKLNYIKKRKTNKLICKAYQFADLSSHITTP